MKKLLVLWDPENPLVPVASVIDALKADASIELRTLTFEEIGHPTLPNRSFRNDRVFHPDSPDAILWVEGGPYPEDLTRFTGLKACWLVNSHLEPGLLQDLGPAFDLVFSSRLRDTSEGRARWLPLAPASGSPVPIPEGLSVLTADPLTPQHLRTQQLLMEQEWEPFATPVVVALGSGGQPHPAIFDALRGGAVVVSDSDSDLRGIAYPGEHAEVIPTPETLVDILRGLMKDSERMARLSKRGRAIVDHLHQPAMRAAQILDGLWPKSRVLSGEDHPSVISVLATSYKYLRRFKVCLESLARQDLPPGSLEIVVADPNSPDGLADFLQEFSRIHPEIRVVHVPLDTRYHRNRGVGINRAFDASRGEVVIGIDGDLVFPSSLVGELRDRVLHAPDRVYGVQRSFVGKGETERILSGQLDPFAEFDRLSLSQGDGEENSFVGVLGYCQAVHRKGFARARYPEELDMVNQSDIAFVERLKREAGIRPQYLSDRTVLHLWHPRNWQGTAEFL